MGEYSDIIRNLGDAAAPQQDEGGYRSLIRSMASASDDATATTLLGASKLNPDTSAKALQHGLPVDASPDVLSEAETAAKIKAARDALSASPMVASWLNDVTNAAVAHDDVAGLSALENAWGKLRSLGAGLTGDFAGGTLRGLGEINQAAATSISGAIGGVGLTGVRDFLREPVLPWWINPTEIMKRPGDVLRQAGDGIDVAKDQRDIGNDIARGLGQMTGQVALAIASGGTSQAVSTATLFAQGADQMATRADEANASPEAKASAVLAGGLVTAITEKFGLDLLLQRVPPNIKNGVMRYLTDVAIAGGAEALQEVTEGIGQNLVTMALLDPKQPLFEDFSREALAAGGTGAIARAVIGAILPGRQRWEQRRQAEAATQAEAAFTEMRAIAEQSKLGERDPERLRDLIRQISGEDGTVHMPVEQVQALYQSGVLDDFALDDLGIADQLQEAAATNGDVIIPADRLMTARLGEGQSFNQIVQHIRMTPGGMTAFEAKTWTEERQATIDRLVEQMATAYDGAEPGQYVYDDIKQQLRDAGRSVAEAKAAAELWRSRYLARAARLGGDADALYVEDRVNIIGQALKPSAAVRDDIDLVISRLQSGNEVKTARTPVLDILKAKGGVQPNGALAAELKAMGITPKAAPGLFRKGGLSAADNLVLSEHQILGDNGFTDAGNGYADPQAILDAIGKEWAGNPLMTADETARAERLDGPVQALRELMTKRGFDYAKATPEEIRAWIDATEKDIAGGGVVAALNQPDGGGGTNRGSYSIERDPYGNVLNIIRFTENADLSTFLHESGHFWLFQLVQDAYDSRATPEARAALQADVQAVLSAIGVKVDVGTADARSILSAIPEEAHERWARMAEAYFMEGRAPSVELQGAFAKFGAWLVDIYKKVSTLGVKLKPEMRGILDRLIATEDAIAAARAKSTYQIPADLKAVLTAKEQAELQAMAERAGAEARAQLQGAVAKELKRQKTEWWKAEREKTLAEVEAEVRRRPVYVAYNLLRHGLDPNGNQIVDEDGKPRAIKLDRAALVDAYGEEIIKALPSGIVTKKGEAGGVLPQFFAGMIGLRSFEDIRQGLMNMQPMAAVVKAETDRVMTERHGSALAPETLADEAADVVANDYQLKLMALQAKYMRRMAGAALDKAAKEKVLAEGADTAEANRLTMDAATADTLAVENAGVPAEAAAGTQLAEMAARAVAGASVDQRKAQAAGMARTREVLRAIDMEAIKAAARQIMAGKLVREVTPDRYSIQAERLSKKVEVAFAGRRYEEAARLKEQQILNLMLAREAAAGQRFLDKAVKKFARINKGDSKLAAGADIDFIKAARAVLSQFGLARPDPQFSVPEWLGRLNEQDEAAARQLRDIIDNLAAGAKPYRDLTLAEFRSLKDAVDALIKNGRDARSVELNGQRIAFDRIAADAASQLAPRMTGANLSRVPTEAERRGRGFLGLRAVLTRVELWARNMDNGKNGVFTTYMVKPVLDAVYAYRDAKRAKLKELLDILKPIRDDLAKPREIKATELGFTFANKAQLLHAVLHSGNLSNLKKLVVGYGWGAEDRNGGFDRSAWDAFMARAWGQGIITKADMDVVQGIWDLLESTKGPAQQAHRKMFGFYFDEIEAAPISTPFGIYRGGYVPAITDKLLTVDGARHLDADALVSQQSSAMFPTADRGFTKGRVNYNQPLALDLLLMPAHLDKVLKFTHIGPAVREVARLTRNKEFGAVVGQVDPVALTDIVEPWLNRSARQTVETPASGEGGRAGDRIFRWLRTTAGMQAMVGNLVNAAQQITGISSALVRLREPGAMMRNLVTIWRNPEAATDAIMAKSAFMRDRLDHSASEMMTDLQDILRDHTKLGKARLAAQKYGYFAQQMMQNWVDRVVWFTAYDQSIGKGLTEPEAVAEADAVVRTSQGSFAPEEVSRLETGPAWGRLFTQFMSYFNAQANLIGAEAAVEVRKSGWRGSVGPLFYIYLAGGFMPAVVAEAITQAARGTLGDEDDDGYVDDLAELFLLSQLRYFAAFVPGLGQGVNLAINLGNDNPADDRLSAAPFATLAEGAVRSVKTISGAIAGEGDASRAVSDAINDIGLITGLPLGWLRKPVSYAVDVAEGDSNPQNIGNIVSGVLTGQDGTAR